MKKLLLISYYFPPAGGGSVQRVLKFAKYLSRFGWEPVVLTIQDGSFPVLDPDLGRQLSENLKVHRVKGWDPFVYYAKFVGKKSEQGSSTSFSSDKAIDWKEKLARNIRGNFFIPDARKGWVKPAIRKGLELIDIENIDAILTSGPPHSTHLVAKGIRSQKAIPWVADFRDLWTEIDYKDDMPQGAWAASRDAKMEKEVLELADVVTTVSPSCKSSLDNLGYSIDCRVIPNGFDPEDFDDIKHDLNQRDSRGLESSFVISYAGTMGPSRNPRKLWESLAKLKSSQRSFNFILRFFGTVDSSVKVDLESYGLLDYCEFRGSVSHKEVLGEMLKSDLLLLLINRVEENTMAGITPGKMYEYMASGVPTLGIGSRSGDAAKILDSTSSGLMLDYEDEQAMEAFILKEYEKNQSLTSPNEIRTADPALNLYNRIKQSGMLASLLDELLINR